MLMVGGFFLRRKFFRRKFFRRKKQPEEIPPEEKTSGGTTGGFNFIKMNFLMVFAGNISAPSENFWILPNSDVFDI